MTYFTSPPKKLRKTELLMLRKALLMNQARRSELIAPVLRSGDRRIEVEVTSVLCIAGSALSSEMR